MLFLILLCIALLAIIVKLYVKLTTEWCRSQVCLQGKTVIVTGANAGIGYETAIDLAKRGARVILACRNDTRAKEAQEKIIRDTHNKNIAYRLIDLSSLASVRKFAQEIHTSEERLDILINNAGIISYEEKKTEDGLNLMMQVNYFGPVLLTELLLDMLKKTSGRIVNVASMAARFLPRDEDMLDLNRFNIDQLYIRSKLCNILYTIKLASRLEGTGVTTYSVHPGIVHTEIFRYKSPIRRTVTNFFLKHFFKNELEGAQTTIYCAVADGIEQYNGENFQECRVASRYKTARDKQLVNRIWNETKEILKLS